jgi:ABC-type Na+ efflux pump permease subunit
VLDRETRTAGIFRDGPGRGLFLVLLAAEAAFVGLCAFRHEWTFLPFHFGVLAMECLLLALAVTASGATSLAAEREGRTLDLVRVTPLTPREIVVGKLVGLLRAFAPCLAVPLLHLAVFSVPPIAVFSPLAFPLVAATGVVAFSAWGVFALSQALDQSNPNRAVQRTMGAFAIVAVLLAANVGLPLHDVLLKGSTDPWVRMGVAYGANPVALTLIPAAALRTGGSDAQNTVVPPPSPGDATVALVCAVAWVALYFAFGSFVYRRLFHMYRTRVDG